ncbi:beta family protein [Streptomyces sp. NK15101]|uniref:beta family protein n=1 Tax=Streptomyces sp. NK15101 TaxID=2873261 RepID=UPI001CED8A0F|nr:beta family protein [Streptomyces sp. NK15101]
MSEPMSESMSEPSSEPWSGPASGPWSGPASGPWSGPASEPTTEPLYVPALPARPSALAAYDGLAPDVRAVVAPLWTVPPRFGRERTPTCPPPRPLDPDPAALGRHAHRALDLVARVQRDRPAWVDTCHVEREPGFPGLGAVRPPLRPVTGVERDPAQQLACAETARAGGTGLGVRVRPNTREGKAEALHRLLERIAFARCPVDLLLDLGAVDEDRGADRTALHALNLLGPLHPWRTVVLLAGAFPRTGPEAYGAPLAETYRADRLLPELLRHTGGASGPRPVHGDYGAHDPAGADRVSDTGDDPFRGALRYTAEQTFLIGEVPAETGHHLTVRALAREIVSSPSFRGARYSEGDRWLQACADGGGLPGTGHPDLWILAGHSQHLTHVARELRRHS